MDWNGMGLGMNMSACRLDWMGGWRLEVGVGGLRWNGMGCVDGCYGTFVGEGRVREDLLEHLTKVGVDSGEPK